jgi:signal transduction histidine kinase
MPELKTQAERERERLIAQVTEIARLTGALAHEIKNPLSTIRLNLELLAEEFAADGESPRDRRVLAKIGVVQRECDRLQTLLDDFLNFAKVRQIKLEPTDLNEEVRRVIDFFRPKAEASKIEIFDYLQADLPSVLLDREAFQGALLNLVLNAQQAMPDGGQLAVGTEAIPRGVALHLIDTGRGMDDQTMSHIFEAFYSTKRGGSGLGLPTTRKIVEDHGGRINVQSEPGRGTRFTIELPTPQRIAGH